jgi:hypothetical protein
MYLEKKTIVCKHGDWFLRNESHYQCFVYDTLEFHDLDFELLQNKDLCLIKS